MSYISKLTEEEIRYVCSEIPYSKTINYFLKNPNEFAKIRPGFRAKSISKIEASELLVDFSNNLFISRFIEKQISDWISQIKKHITNQIGAGDSQKIAVLNTLPFSFFADNIGLYFKLVEEEYPEEYIEIMSSAIRTIKEVKDKSDRLSEELKAKAFDITNLHIKLDKVKLEFEKTKIKLNKRLLEVDVLKNKLSKFESYKIDVLVEKKRIGILESELAICEKTIEELKTELNQKKYDRRQIEHEQRMCVERQEHNKRNRLEPIKEPQCPKNIDEFREYLGYNFENIGVPGEYCSMIEGYLSKILFRGLPILVNRLTSSSVMKCVANALIGKNMIDTLLFSQNVAIEEVERFLSSGERIVCLDNFLGNFNEIELLPLFERHRDKIIFTTVAYDRTINYIAKDFLRHCYYLNFNRINELTVSTNLTEDPSTFIEVNADFNWIGDGNRYSDILKDISRELGFSKGIIESKLATIISNEEDLWQALAFDILPYCVDVLQVSPYNKSDRLQKYVRRCPNKELIEEWFSP